MTDKKTLLVAGGSGFLGQRIVEQLLKKGYHVVATVFRKDIGKLMKHKDLTYIKLDLSVEKDLTNLTKYDIDAVFHTAAKIDFGATVKVFEECQKINCLGTAKLIEYCRQNDIAKVIYSSTISVYSPDCVSPIKEDSPTRPNTYYGLSKLCGELVCDYYHETHDINISILRYTGLYGDNASTKDVVNIFLKNIRAKKPLLVLNGKNVRNYIYVKDAALANVLAYENGLNGVFNIGSHEELSVMDITLKMKKVFAEFRPAVKLIKGKAPITKIVADISKFRTHYPAFPKFSFLKAMENIKKEWK